MEEFKWIFYILLAVIVLVVRMWLKAFQSPQPAASNRPAKPNVYPVPNSPATAYQDILKEMQAAQSRGNNTLKPTSLESKSSRENTRREARSLEKTETPVKSLESLPGQPKPVIKKPSAIELARRSTTREPQVQTTGINYGKLLRNPQNVRTAFIMSEILNRRFDL